MDKRARKPALRNFLKECRSRLSPEEVGIPSIGRRRVPGLRREEVAELCGISLAWYTLLETGRDIRVSPRLLDRLSCVLHLTDYEKIQLFSLAIDELPTVPCAGPYSEGAAGREYFEIRQFAQRSQSASSVRELAYLTTDLLFDLGQPVEDAFFISADHVSREFVFLAQRYAAGFQPVPKKRFKFSSVHDAKEVLLDGELFTEVNVADKHHEPFSARARQYGAGRFISKGVQVPIFSGAIGYFQVCNEPFTEHERELVALVAEILHLALGARC